MDHNIFVARHPIFNKSNKVDAYEILYRSGSTNAFNNIDGDVASRSVINRVLMDFGIEKVSNGKTVFINFTTNLLMDDTILILPKDVIVLEILETCIPDDNLYERVKFLKQAGYKLALDDYIYNPKWDRFLPLVEYVKVDFSLVKGAERKNILKKLTLPHLKILAEKVENYDEFHEARMSGYHLFQGYYFCKPSLITTQKISENKINYLQIVQEMNKNEINYTALESLIKRDLSLTYKLLKFLNSSYFGLPNKVNSVKNALALIGQNEIKKWISLIALDSLIDDKPQELIKVSLSRALFCEAISMTLHTKNDHESYFLMGLLSLIDAILDKDKEEVLSKINIEKELYDTLTGLDTKMSPYLNMTIALEANDFVRIAELKDIVSLPLDVIMEHYLNAISISDAIMGQI